MSHGTEKRVRTRHLTVRLTEDERTSIDAAAERAGLMTGSYARQKLLDGPAPRQVRRPPIERRELSRLLGELGKIGSNLNQLTKSANQGLVVYGGEIEAVLAALRSWGVALLKALGRSP